MDKTRKLEKELSAVTEKLVDTYEELTLVYDLVAKLGGMLDADKVLKEVLNESVNISGARWGFIMLIDDETGKLYLKASKGIDKAAQGIIEAEYEPGKGLISRAMEEERPIIGDDILNEEEGLSNLRSSVLVVPLRFNKKKIGAICLSDKVSGEPFYSTDMKLLETLGVMVSVLIENARLYTNLQGLFFSAVEALSFAIDEKDPYTHGHSKRVTEYSMELANFMNLTEREKAIINLASIMHDVGKIGVPEAVLHKKDKLNDEEWEKIKQHPLKGDHILQPMRKTKKITTNLSMTFEDIQSITPGVKYHHERYDGNGYPDKLKAEDIPFIARIIAVADAYDAMTSNRAYRKAMSPEAACRELRRNEGQQHDPEIVKSFLKLKGYEE